MSAGQVVVGLRSSRPPKVWSVPADTPFRPLTRAQARRFARALTASAAVAPPAPRPLRPRRTRLLGVRLAG